jgi:hypothetical protein
MKALIPLLLFLAPVAFGQGLNVPLGQQTMQYSMPVVLASDQSPIPVGPVVVSGGTLTALQGNPPWSVTGTGIAGTSAPGVVSVQGVTGGTPVPISGSITATNPSVAPTGAAVPADATYSGMNVGGNLVGLTGTANGLKVDGSAVTQPVSGTVAVSAITGALPAGANNIGSVNVANFPGTQPISGTVAVSNFPATQPVSGTVTADQGGAPWTMVGVGTPGTQSGGVVTVQGDPSGTPVPVSGSFTPTITSATFQDGSIQYSSLTSTFQTVITTGGVVKHVDMRNNTNSVVQVSLNGGSTIAYTLDAGDQVSLDLESNGSSIPSGTALQALYPFGATAPTSGSIRINAFY